MAVSRYYSSSAVATTLTAPINSSVTTIVVGSVSGFPIVYPYTVSIDADNSNKELVEVTAAVGSSLTVTRGVDGTANVSHTLGAKVSHDHSARDFRDSREHEDAVAAHGATGAVVGTTNTQTLTNKNLTSGTNSFPSSLATDAEVTAAVAAEAALRTSADAGKAALVHTHAQADVTNLVSDLAAKAPVSTTVTLTGAQAVTNKDLTSGTNTFPTSLATLTTAQVLTNKNMTSGTNTFPATLATAASVAALAPRMYTRAQAAPLAVGSGGYSTITNLLTLVIDEGAFTYSAGVLTCVLAGRYSFTANAVLAANTLGSLRGAALVYTDTSLASAENIAQDQRANPTTSNSVVINLSAQRFLDFGDTIELKVFQNTGSSLNVSDAFISSIRHGA